MSADDLAFAPLLPLLLLAGLAAAGLLPVGIGLWRRASGAVWRLAALITALLFLAGPERISRTGTALPSVLLLAVDHSASMRIGDRAALAAAAVRSLTGQAERIAGLRIKQIEITNQPPEGTQMSAAISAGLADIPAEQRAGVIAVTDGAISDPPPRTGTTLHALITAAGEQTDRRLRVIRAPGYGIVGQSVQIIVAVDDLGAAPGAGATLSWTQDGAPGGQISVAAGSPTSITVPVSHGGPTTIGLAVSARPGEASLLNNRAALTLNGVRDRLRVLLISGEPHEGERAWRRLLKADPAVDLVHFTILRPPGKDDLTPVSQLALIAFPTRELFVEKIRQFDLIILDRFSEARILPPSYLDNIAEYVRGGGGLLVSAGPEFADPGSIANSPIGAVLPAGPGGGLDGSADPPAPAGAFRPIVTALGHRHPVTQDLPGDAPQNTPGALPSWGEWYRRVAVGQTSGDTVMQAGPGGPPLLVLSHVGLGRVAMLLSDQIWLWSRGHQGGGPQAELLRRVAHWLMKEPELDENRLTARMTDGRLIIQHYATSPPDPASRLTVTDPEGHQTMLGLGEDGGAALPASSPGLWQARLGGQTAYAAAPPEDPAEWADLRATATVLRPLATSVHWLGRSGPPPLASLALTRRHPMQLTRLRHDALLPAWIALPLLLALVLGAWRREQRS